ncbi:zinc finger CCCH domain-containing protein 18-like isoform X2 [Dermacentor silvarum]|uniref:zinc finger CCCH domain-containing protein 18-like isoform X2 n=1 Tax=Dermacentor silvarum TaxID=543639 RepID=UPI0018993FBE|nr:zinc finger CCCH domain-containing protein 18-like isoform X2 [Dermacentor silvarum]
MAMRMPEEEAARLERRREMARERARRRRADPELRAREAEAKRRRREDPEVRAREAEANRQRREDPEVREREAESRRARRAGDPEYRAREIAARLRYDEVHREENRLADRRRRNADPGLRVFENFRRRQRAATTGADERFRHSSDSDVGPDSPVCEGDELGCAAEGSDGSSRVGPSKATATEKPQKSVSKGCQADLPKPQKTASKGCQADFLPTEKPQETTFKGCQTTGITRTQTRLTHAEEVEQEPCAELVKAFPEPEKLLGSRKRPASPHASRSTRASASSPPTCASRATGLTTSSGTPKRSRLSATSAASASTSR